MNLLIICIAAFLSEKACVYYEHADERLPRAEINEVYVFPSAEAINMPLNALFDAVENITGRPVTRTHVFVAGEILHKEHIVEDLQILIDALNQGK